MTLVIRESHSLRKWVFTENYICFCSTLPSKDFLQDLIAWPSVPHDNKLLTVSFQNYMWWDCLRWVLQPCSCLFLLVAERNQQNLEICFSHFFPHFWGESAVFSVTNSRPSTSVSLTWMVLPIGHQSDKTVMKPKFCLELIILNFRI